jgi:hypothetical protein
MPQSHQSKAKRKAQKGKKRHPVARTTVQPTAKPVARTIPQMAPSAPRSQETVPQYPYLGRELKRIGILAGAMIVVLIIVSVVL